MYSKIITISLFAGLISACGGKETTQIAENTFVHKEKVYKIVGNELTEIADLSLGIKTSKLTKKDMGNVDISYIKDSATTKLETLYRGNILYFTLYIIGINDLKDNYSPGEITVCFKDEFNFFVHQTTIPTNELIKVVDPNNQIMYFEYNGKTEMSAEINQAIKRYNITSSIRKARE